MDDPEDSKPEDWEKPEHIADPDATKPDDWDDEMDGEWEPPQIDNPEFKGEWKAKQIDNPDYKVGFLFIAAIQHLMVEIKIKVLVSISKQLSLSIIFNRAHGFIQKLKTLNTKKTKHSMLTIPSVELDSIYGK